MNLNKISSTIKNQENNLNDIKNSLKSLEDKLKKIVNDDKIKFSNNRFGKIAKLINILDNNKLLTVEELYRYSEAMDLLDTLNYIDREDISDSFLDKLKKGINGSYLLRDESKKTTARDYFFEIKIATKFKKSGFEISFEPSSDVQVTIDEISYPIECKRPQNEKKIVQKAEEAYKQLMEQEQKGIIALDLSKVFFNEITPEHDLIFRTYDDIKKIINIFDESYSPLINNVNKNRKKDILDDVLFIICHFRFPCIILEPYNIVIINHFFTIGPKNSPIEIKRIINKLK